MTVVLAAWLGSARAQEPASTGPAVAAGKPASGAPAENQKGYLLGTNGTLFLTFPMDWQDGVKHVREKDKVFDAVFFTPADTNRFNFMVEIVGLGGDLTNVADQRAALNYSGDRELTNCVEKSLKIHDFKGEQAVGAYFRVTDRRLAAAPPNAGDFKYLTHGFAVLGPLVLSFELVSNDPARDEPAAIEVLRRARLGH
jgi:hypothetical protein